MGRLFYYFVVQQIEIARKRASIALSVLNRCFSRGLPIASKFMLPAILKGGRPYKQRRASVNFTKPTQAQFEKTR